MGYEPYIQNVKRYGRTFQVLRPDHFVSPFFFMAASTTGTAGDVVKYGTAEDTVTPATSGLSAKQVAGFLLQDVKDLDAGPVKGYRNLNNTVENLGGNVGVLQGAGNVCYTKRYIGTPAVGDSLVVDANANTRPGDYGVLNVNNGTTGSVVVAVVEAITSSAVSNVEPQQLSTAGGNAFIRIRTLV